MGMFKTKKEIEIMRECGKRLSHVLDEIEKAITPGKTPQQLDEFSRRLILDLGDEPSFLHYWPEGALKPYPATLCVSTNDEVVHGIPGKKKFKEGDIVCIDLGIKHEGFHSDSARTVPVGKIDDTARKLIDATREALVAGIKVARAGNHVGDIGFAVSEVVKRYGFSIVKELGGHGIGTEVHEDPHIPNFGKPGEGLELKEGMVLALEPIVNEGSPRIYLTSDGYTFKTKDGKRSAHFEHTILITKGEPEIFTQP
ncbi:MAG: type I methionyl aminopeptidase [Candidatus Yonathbacteria bacterium]|nr:type I methionyl aminopeptidase [Candidatus Yonathbacteria bacterium]